MFHLQNVLLLLPLIGWLLMPVPVSAELDDNDNIGDAGAVWSPAEIFADPTFEIYGCTNFETQGGYNVTAARGVVPSCAAIPTPTNTPRPGNVTATGAQMKNELFQVRTVFKQGDHPRPVGFYENTGGSTQTVRLDYDIVGPCGPIYHTQVDQYPALSPNGSEDVGAYIPPDACLGVYTMTFGVTYNTLTTASTTFTVIAGPTPTPTHTVTRTRTPTPTMTRKPGSVTAVETWTEEGGNAHNAPVYTFSPGDVMRSAGWILNGERSGSTTELQWTAVGPCGLLYSLRESWGPYEPFPGYWNVESASYTIPPEACPGTYTNTMSVIYNGTTTASSTFMVLAAATPTRTATPTSTSTPTQTRVPTDTPTLTATVTPTETGTPTFTATVTPTEPVVCANPPAKPNLLTPKDEALIRKGQATLKWQAAECAESYDVIVREQQTKNRVEKRKGLTALEYQTIKLEPAHSYQWRVIAVNGYGHTKSKWREMQTR